MCITDNVAYRICGEVGVSEQPGELVDYISLAGLLSNQLEHQELLLWVLRPPYQQAKQVGEVWGEEQNDWIYSVPAMSFVP